MHVGLVWPFGYKSSDWLWRSCAKQPGDWPQANQIDEKAEIIQSVCMCGRVLGKENYQWQWRYSTQAKCLLPRFFTKWCRWESLTIPSYSEGVRCLHQGSPHLFRDGRALKLPHSSTSAAGMAYHEKKNYIHGSLTAFFLRTGCTKWQSLVLSVQSLKPSTPSNRRPQKQSSMNISQSSPMCGLLGFCYTQSSHNYGQEPYPGMQIAAVINHTSDRGLSYAPPTWMPWEIVQYHVGLLERQTWRQAHIWVVDPCNGNLMISLWLA